jgi:hypothetical protein
VTVLTPLAGGVMLEKILGRSQAREKAENLSGRCPVNAYKRLQIPARTCKMGNFGKTNPVQRKTRKTLLDNDLEIGLTHRGVAQPG